jgi:hypothetical protein
MAGVKFNNPDLINALLGLHPMDDHGVEFTTKLLCTFCGIEVDQTRATYGVGRNTMTVHPSQVIYNQKGEQLSYLDKVKVSGQEVVACPKCCLNIKPSYSRCPSCRGKSELEQALCGDCKGTKEGPMISQGTKFPDFD